MEPVGPWSPHCPNSPEFSVHHAMSTTLAVSPLAKVEPGRRRAESDVRLIDESSSELRPPLKWAGGKRWLVPFLRPVWLMHSQRRLVEPFAGGLAIALGLRPKSALLSDINPHTVNFYSWLKQGLVISIPLDNSAETYYGHRMRFNELVLSGRQESKEAAELFYYLNRTCYNGLCRFNRSGAFNVPFGRYKTIRYAQDFLRYRDALRSWEFCARDFEKVKPEPDDLVYADPPYDVEFTSYSKEEFRWEDQVRLADWLAGHEGPVVASNQATRRIVRLYKERGFRLRYVDAPRMISCNGDRTPAREVIATRGL